MVDIDDLVNRAKQMANDHGKIVFVVKVWSWGLDDITFELTLADEFKPGRGSIYFAAWPEHGVKRCVHMTS